MGAVPAKFNLDKFVGQQLTQICIGSCDLQFRFHSGNYIACYNRVMVEMNGKSTLVFAGDLPRWPDVTPLPFLTGRDVISWRVEGSHDFSITLSGEALLRFQSSDDPHEEFVVYPDLQTV